MKKWLAWIFMIPICVVALNYLYRYMMFSSLEDDMEPTALIIFIPIFFIICFCNVIVHLYALVTGVIKRNNSGFLGINSFIKKGILKWVGLGFIICYGYDLFIVFKSANISGVIWNLLAIIITLFYVSWFNTFNILWIKKWVVFI